MASSSFTAMVFEAGGSRVFGGLEGGSFELISSLVCYRISEATLGIFSAPFRGFFVLHCHGVWGWRIPCFGGLEGGSFELISSLVCYIELISSLVCYRISEATLGSFSAPFRGFFVLHCHGVWGWQIPCFGGLEGGSFELIWAYFKLQASFLGFQKPR